MKFAFSVHSLERMRQRNIHQEIVEQILEEPQQKLVGGALTIYQSLVRESDKTYLFRIFVNTDSDAILLLWLTKLPKSANTMKAKYDEAVDVLYISFNEDAITESDESKPGIIIDYNEQGNPVGIEILSASKRVSQPGQIVMELAA